ncbi:carbonic anhydrase [Fluviispira multicolorata]|uniref:carbonic anhydrase n=1 Tax=Fluviispira multicolorata TaxID=2654512 RepID=A0A833JDL7_9BACT|nr:carbonic anhydrase family protein [Fluviispira multicolorata]KAB8031955.1 carbonate dehydratase [Fluviispira multicolorata]
MGIRFETSIIISSLFFFFTIENKAFSQLMANADKAVHWSYEGATGPAKWGTLKHEFQSCIAGKKQSPVDVKSKESKKNDEIPVLSFAYFSTPLNILNNGHTIQVNYEKGSKLTINHDVYELLQFHFHTPSEHALDGKRSEMEVHFVHKKEDGNLAVVGVLMKKGNKNKAFEALFDNLPEKSDSETKVEAKFNGIDIFPQDTGYYNYSGSLTTPPCSEIVNWILLKKPIEVSPKQLERFSKIFHMNARPIQKLNDRKVEEKE